MPRNTNPFAVTQQGLGRQRQKSKRKSRGQCAGCGHRIPSDHLQLCTSNIVCPAALNHRHWFLRMKQKARVLLGCQILTNTRGREQMTAPHFQKLFLLFFKIISFSLFFPSSRSSHITLNLFSFKFRASFFSNCWRMCLCVCIPKYINTNTSFVIQSTILA